MKIKWNYVLLILILLFAFYLRIYHVDYPVVGYHNWKETHYLTEARNFAEDGFFENGFFIPSWDYPRIHDDPSGAHSDTFPTISIIVGLIFNIFGISLFAARLVSILFSLGSIVFMFFLIKLLFKRNDLALLTSSILAILPLAVFFGRQVQLINSALFFCLGGLYFYFKWLKNYSWKYTILFSIFIALGVLTKYTFALFVLPMFMVFPFKKLKNKKLLKKHLFIIFIILLSLFWIVYSFNISGTIGEELSSTKLNLIFEKSFWNIMKSFAIENYSVAAIVLFFFGVLSFLSIYFKKHFKKKKNNYNFIFYYLIFSIIWFIYASFKLQGHNYHQYPLLPLISFMMAYFILFLSINLSKIFRNKKLKLFFILGILILLISPMGVSKNRMFDTQFIGLDVAGEYVNNNKLEGERIMHSSHQAYGILWHGNIKGTRGIPSDVEQIQYAEQNLNASWLFIYAWDLDVLASNNQRSKYIKNNYEIKQVGFNIANNKAVPLYFLLKRGGVYSEKELNFKLQNGEVLQKEYELSFGKKVLHYINL